MKGYIFFLCSLCLLTFNCNNKVEIEFQETDLEIITGLYLVNNVGNRVGVVGNPNEKSSGLFTYPNPAFHHINIDSQIIIEKAWIVPGDNIKKFQETKFIDFLDSHQYIQSDIANNSIKEILINSSNHEIDFTDIGSGYYRIFVLLEDGTIDWKNICILRTGDSQAYDEFLKEWK